jgi:hypothetical protein
MKRTTLSGGGDVGRPTETSPGLENWQPILVTRQLHFPLLLISPQLLEMAESSSSSQLICRRAPPTSSLLLRRR